MTSNYHRFFAAVLAVCLLAGCAGVSAGTIPAASRSPAAEPGAPEVVNTEGATALSGLATATLTATLSVSATPGPSPTPTPDLRLPPEDWREWPVVPVASGRALDIYRAGQTLGNDPRRFSKVGDCQAIREVLMGMFDRPGSYALKPEREHLKPAIGYFQGSFNRDGMAVQGGFNAAAVLSPLWANPELCQPGENPLACEYRLHQPAFVIISLEMWWDGRTPERYMDYMRRIIDYSIEKGIVPILSTKADNVEGDHAINLATAQLAYEYDLPLWNWWLAAQELPNGGLDPYRPDGFHISYAAWNPRAFTALEALDSVWRGVDPAAAAADAVSVTEAQSAQASGAVVGTPPAATLAVHRTAVATVTPGTAGSETALAEALPAGFTWRPITMPTPSADAAVGGSDEMIFGLARRVDERQEAAGIIRVNLTSGERTELAGPGWQFQAVSADGRYLLMNRGAELFLATSEGETLARLSTTFFAEARSGAIFSGPSSVAFIAARGEGTLPGPAAALVHYPLDGGAWQVLVTRQAQPVELYGPAASEKDGVRWGGGECVSGECWVDTLAASAPGRATTYTRLLPLLNPTQAALTATPGGAGQAPGAVGAPAGARPAWSTDGAYSAYTQSINGDKSVLILGRVGKEARVVELPGTYPVELVFNPAGDRLAVLQLNRSGYSGRWGAIHTLLVNPVTLGVQRLADAPRGLNPRAALSADGRRLLVTATYPDADGAGSTVLVALSDLSNRPFEDLTERLGLTSTDLLLVSGLAWLPGGAGTGGVTP